MDNPTLFRIGRCADCAVEFPAALTGPVAKRCPRCREQARREKMYADWQKQREARYRAERRDATCADCGQQYRRHPRDTKSFQCRPCRDAAKADWKKRWAETYADKAHRSKRKWHAANRDKVKAYKHRRRVLARDAEADEFVAQDIFERDNWTCQLCGKHLDPAVEYPSNESPSIDHIVPVSLGGTHTLANVQAACMGCNRSKGARMG